MKICLNADLANTFGNLLNRCTSSKINSRQHFPHFDLHFVKSTVPEALEIIEVSSKLVSNCYQAYLDGNFYIGISQTMDFLRLVNGLINVTQPWSLVQSSHNQDRLDAILYVSLEAIRVAAILLEPVIPQTSKLVLDKLNVDLELRTWKSAENAYADLPTIKNTDLNHQKYVLFSKLH